MNTWKKSDNLRNRNRKKGFTLLELMAVIMIIGILALAIVPNFMDAPQEARQQQAKVDMKAIETALKMYKLNNGSYPTTDQGLQALVEQPQSGNTPKNWKKYLDKMPKDPWGNDYLYLSPGVHGDFDLTSYGADGAPEGDEFDMDINNWEL